MSVDQYRRPVLRDAMPAVAEHTTRGVYTHLDAEPVESNGDTDRAHPLLAHPPPFATSTPFQRLDGCTADAVRRESTGARVCARMRAYRWSPSYLAVSRAGARLSSIKHYIDGQAQPPL